MNNQLNRASSSSSSLSNKTNSLLGSSSGLNYNAGSTGNKLLPIVVSTVSYAKTSRQQQLLQQPSTTKIPPPLIERLSPGKTLMQASLKIGGSIGFQKPPQQVKEDSVMQKSQSPGKGLKRASQGALSSMRVSTTDSSSNNNHNSQGINYRREVPKSLLGGNSSLFKTAPTFNDRNSTSQKPCLISKYPQDDDSVEIDIETLEACTPPLVNNNNTIEISSTSTKGRSLRDLQLASKTDEELLGLTGGGTHDLSMACIDIEDDNSLANNHPSKPSSSSSSNFPAAHSNYSSISSINGLTTTGAAGAAPGNGVRNFLLGSNHNHNLNLVGGINHKQQLTSDDLWGTANYSGYQKGGGNKSNNQNGIAAAAAGINNDYNNKAQATTTYDYYSFSGNGNQVQKKTQLYQELKQIASSSSNQGMNSNSNSNSYNNRQQENKRVFNKSSLLQSARQRDDNDFIEINDEDDDCEPIIFAPSSNNLSKPSLNQNHSILSSQTSAGRATSNSLFMQRFNQPKTQFQVNQPQQSSYNKAAEEEVLNRFRKTTPQQPLQKPIVTTLSPVTDSFYSSVAEKMLGRKNDEQDLRFKKTAPSSHQQLSNTSFKKNAQEVEIKSTRNAIQSEAEIKKMRESINKKIGFSAVNAITHQLTSSTTNVSSSSSKKHGSLFGRDKTPEETYKELKQRIRTVYSDRFQKEEEEKLEKERQREQALKLEQEELKAKQQKEKADIFKSLFGVGGGALAPPQEKPNNNSSNTKQSTTNDPLFKQMMEERQQRQAAEAEGREIAIQQKVFNRAQYEAEMRAEQERKLRYINRRTVDELINPILNLDIIKMFEDKIQQGFEEVPLKFGTFEEYQETWIPLFLYETYSQMISRRTEGDKDRELMEAQGLKFNSMAQRKKHFEGFLQKSGNSGGYIELKLYESAKNDPDKNGNYIMNVIDCLKEFDLLLITEQPLPVDEAKKITGVEYLRQIKNEQGKLLCLVTQRRKRDAPYISLKVDSDLHEEFICLKVRNLDFLKVHVYYYDSLITSVREFRTIKSCEFFPTANFILDPSLINKVNESPETTLDPQKREKMLGFIESQRGSFNESQLQALENVVKMKKEDFLLIQGPPGTGKTHTIQGIITMLVKASVKRILICAPSNAAIDEIVLRIANFKLFGSVTEAELKERLLRIGSMDYEPLPAVKKYTLDSKLKEEMDGPQNLAQPEKGSSADLENKLDLIKQRLQCILTIRKIVNSDQIDKEKTRYINLLKVLYPQSESVLQFCKIGKDAKIKELEMLEKGYLKKQEEVKQIASNTQMQRAKPKNKRSEVEKKIIERAQIICTTLSMSAIEKLDILGGDNLEYLIVDEACQCVELNCLIPFEHNPQKVILVGDQQQLPATTFSDNSDRTKYSRSLFERFLDCGVNRFMLSIQYRMHPLIREFPSEQFYEGRLQDAQSLVQTQQATKSLVVREIEKTIQNLVFFDLRYAQEESRETSKSNRDEAMFIEAIFSDLVKILQESKELPPNVARGSYSEKMDFIAKELKGKIGIITPYKSQVKILKDHIYPMFRNLKFPLDLIEINTVDAYQGREKEIIIISCVRGSQERTLGFLNDYRRMNVAITRAKHFLWVVGNSRTLKRNKNWEDFINFSKNKCESLSENTKSSPNSKLTVISRPKSYIQLASKSAWQHHKLFNILTGKSSPRSHQDDLPPRSPPPLSSSSSSELQDADQSPQKSKAAVIPHHIKLDNKQSKDEDKVTKKRKNSGFQEEREELNQQQVKKREKKYEEKYGEKESPSKRQRKVESTGKGNLREIIETSKVQEVAQKPLPESVQPKIEPTKPTGSTAVQAAFDQLFASLGSSSKATATSDPKPQPKTSPATKPALDLNTLLKKNPK